MITDGALFEFLHYLIGVGILLGYAVDGAPDAQVVRVP